MIKLPEAIILILLLTWNLASPAFRTRSFQSGLKQGLITRGGLLHAFSFFASLTIFVVNAVMLGYQSIFLVPVPLAAMAFTIFVAKSCFDHDFRTWSLGPKLTHCLMSSIFPISTPRPVQKVSNVQLYSVYVMYVSYLQL